jgi:hypothetical protein
LCSDGREEAVMISDRERWLVARRALYCGIACQVALLLGLGIDKVRPHDLGPEPWAIKVADVVYAALPSVGMCVGTVLALRKPRLVIPAVVAGVVIGYVDELVAKRILWMLQPSEAAVELGGLGPLVDRHYSMIYGFTGGELAGGFIASLLVALFCASLQGEWRAIVGGFGGGLVVSSLVLIISIMVTQSRRPGVLFVWPLMVFSFFVYGFALGGGVALGERVGCRLIGGRGH